MVMDVLHNSIIQMEWKEVDATIATDSGKKMAKVYFKEDLPLHMAVERKAPDSTILAILNLYPEAAAQVGRLGGTPLHLAAQQKLSPSVLVALIRACPEVLDQEDENCRFVSDYTQKNDLSREALSRPTACWIEDVEKEEYNQKIQRRKAQLQQKIHKLNTALDNSKKRREALNSHIDKLEPRLQGQRDVLSRLGDLEKQMRDLYDSNHGDIEKARERIKSLSDEVSIEPDDEETMMRSLMRRTYMQGVQRQYERLTVRSEQARKDINGLRTQVIAHRREKFGAEAKYDDDEDDISM